MAFNRKDTQREYLDITQFTPCNVRVLSDKLVSFTLRGKGVSLYNMRLIDSKNGMFITPPQEKGKDGKYYNQYAVYLSDDDETVLINAVTKLLGNEH